ncbi:Uncharacterized protein Rs2_01154 [Raphanus sativus]|nr:Uncharacterized protein Rs2_01154 [Raphanus sativus]
MNLSSCIFSLSVSLFSIRSNEEALPERNRAPVPAADKIRRPASPSPSRCHLITSGGSFSGRSWSPGLPHINRLLLQRQKLYLSPEQDQTRQTVPLQQPLASLPLRLFQLLHELLGQLGLFTKSPADS